MKKIKAFVMVRVGTTEYLGSVTTAKEEVDKIPGVINAYTVFGGCDLIVEVEAKDLGELSRLVADRIGSITGVVSTET